MPALAAARMMQAITRATHYAHSKQVVRRDLKPANILPTAAGQPKVTDFGLAKQLDKDVTGTRAGVIMGAPSYMAPEQADADTKSSGHMTDVHSLGAMLYGVLTGRPPFQGPNVASVLGRVRAGFSVDPTRLRPLPARDLETICLRRLEEDPAKRQATAGDLERRPGTPGRSSLGRPARPKNWSTGAGGTVGWRRWGSPPARPQIPREGRVAEVRPDPIGRPVRPEVHVPPVVW